MKKSSKRKKAQRKASPHSAPVVQTVTRRDWIRRVLWIGGGATLLGGAGIFGVRSVQATIAEHNLGRIGQGVPVVVQVHDPQCPTCTALQRQTRKALRRLDGEGPLYLVANIKTVEGEVFATRYGVPHVTLLLFDGRGNLQQVLRGMRQADELEMSFRNLARGG